jgi:hypothetical protein
MVEGFSELLVAAEDDALVACDPGVPVGRLLVHDAGAELVDCGLELAGVDRSPA